MQHRDEVAIAEVIHRLVESWNQHDMRAFANLFAEDADFVDVFGNWFRSRAEIEEALAARHATVFKNSRFTEKEVAVRVIKPGVAAVNAVIELSGALDPKDQPLPPGSRRDDLRNGKGREEGVADPRSAEHLSHAIPDDSDAVFKGRVIVRYAGHEEPVEAGQTCYMPPGHAPEALEDSESLQLSPAAELRNTTEVISRNMAVMAPPHRRFRSRLGADYIHGSTPFANARARHTSDASPGKQESR